MKNANMRIEEVSGQVSMTGNIHNHGPRVLLGGGDGGTTQHFNDKVSGGVAGRDVVKIQASPGAINIVGDQNQIHIHLTLPSAEIMAALIEILKAGVGSPSPNASSSD